MISAIRLRLKDEVYTLGVFLLLLSLLVFCIPLIAKTSFDNTFGIFLLNFALAAIYFFVLLGNRRLRKHSRRIHTIFIFLLLFLISAYALNREMTIFDNSATWLCIVLVCVSINYLSFSFLSYMPAWLKHLMSFVLAVSTIVFVYLGIYLLPYYPISIGASFVLGVSLHTFVPLLFTVYSIVLIRRTTVRYPTLWTSFVAGIIMVIVFTGFFVYKWNKIVNTINNQYQQEVSEDGRALPAWIRVAQKVPKGWITERILKTDLVYNTPSFSDNFFRMPQKNFGEETKHDPLVMISSLFTTKVHLSDDEKIQILKSIYDSRNEAEERLWSGEHLKTEYVNTTVQLMPLYRLAYTEKIVTVSNTNSRDSWNRDEEAIYTFHLPEGGVVTSLSLWIDGKEAKGILTTKKKAAIAYNTIVGHEQRDPSVVHWQEGNRVSVRVFPVMAGESRIFKIGITSPLEHRGSTLLYTNFYFDGPSSSGAEENVKVECNNADNVSFSEKFNNVKGYYRKSGKYNADWSLMFDDKGVVDKQFSFNGYNYGVQEYTVHRQHADFERVYLDINAAWSQEEINSIYELVKSRKVYVYNGEMQKLNQDNFKEMVADLQQQRFSMFPFFAVKDPERALVITKNAGLTPNLDDISNSEFYTKLKYAASFNGFFKVFQLGNELSPYLQSLKELRWFSYEHGDLNELKNIIESSSFCKEEENDEKIIVHNADIFLTKNPAANNGLQTAPDHLMRLFTYNHLMQQIGKKALNDSTYDAALIDEAGQANIVSPVSSLVVLESQQDYERFNIENSKNSLENASLKSKGAVPEPHEWALIILAVLMFLFAKYTHLFKRKLFR